MQKIAQFVKKIAQFELTVQFFAFLGYFGVFFNVEMWIKWITLNIVNLYYRKFCLQAPIGICKQN